jgi:hypothetical protein
MTTGKAIPADACRAGYPSSSSSMPSSAAPADRGTQGWGSLMEDGAHQRGLAASGEQQASFQQFEQVTPSAQRSAAAGSSR